MAVYVYHGRKGDLLWVRLGDFRSDILVDVSLRYGEVKKVEFGVSDGGGRGGGFVFKADKMEFRGVAVLEHYSFFADVPVELLDPLFRGFERVLVPRLDEIRDHRLTAEGAAELYHSLLVVLRSHLRALIDFVWGALEAEVVRGGSS